MSEIYKTEAGASEIRRRYQEVLATWPVPAEHVRVPTREGETFVVASGPKDAPPVLLLHGSGSNTTNWLGDVTSWSRHFRTYAVDLIGEPGMSAPSRPPMDSDAYALWLDDVLAGLGVTTASIVGMSLGGWTALDYATRRPERVTRLALLCPGGLGRLGTARMLFSVVLTRPFGRWGVRRSARTVTGLDMPGDGPALDDLVLTFKQFSPRTSLPVFSDEVLKRLVMPVLVIAGDKDVVFDTRVTARRVRECVPHATMTVLPGAGHAILDRTETVLSFLRG